MNHDLATRVFVVLLALVGVLLLLVVLVGAAEAQERKDVETTQVCLTVLGFAPGPVDGAAGPKTMGALQAWAWANFGPAWAQVSTLLLQERLVQQCLAALEALEARPVAKTPARESW